MICRLKREEIEQSVEVIRESFRTVAETLGITKENAPGFTGCSTTVDKLREPFDEEKRPMFVAMDGD